MGVKKWGVAAAAVGLGATALTACSSDGGSGDEEQGGGGGAVRIAEVNEFTSFNNNSAAGNLDTNSKIAYLTRSSFIYVDDELNIVPDEGFGTVEVESEDPLTVTYTVNEGIEWSDGEPVDADDLMLAWAVQSGYYDDATIDPATGEVSGGTSYFTYAGDTAGLGLTELPEVGEDGRSVTLTYTEPYADYELVDLGIDLPAHVVAEGAGTTSEEMLEAFQSTPRGNADAPAEANPTIKAVADFWNTGFDVTSLPDDESLFLSSGPFIVDSWDAGESMTLVKNENYGGDREVSYDSVVVRFIGDANAQVTALRNGEVDIISPQPSADTLDTLESIETATVEQGDQFSYDHLDLNFGSEVFADPTVREAFMKIVPRQQILDSIVTPLNPEAAILDSQIFFPGQEGYDEAAGSNGSDAYAEPDIAGAQELLAGRTPTVRVLYNTENPNRVDAFTLLQQNAAEAGFVIEDLGSPDWSSLLPGGDYDASIFGWISSGVGVAGVPQIFGTGGGGNYNGYSNPEADALMDELIVTLDRDEQIALQTEIDSTLWADFYGLPLFASPGVLAYGERVTGPAYYPGQTGAVWNFWEWELS
ncbi:ABC transporter family substrate-binding protein [Nocardioides zeae]|uniref:ABC transporter family substrate-binding protein n=1 Tax=Nocardioides imazamoxiresistens TaxID=3231893 RepID=A0ABU3PXC9_9ACTN|nr:ABC transporter family substrate-binding protein [Nocardioides zeae]MDT9593888.1 ABC transporter family substrate-binding protein [Nocardioides zeae]